MILVYFVLKISRHSYRLSSAWLDASGLFTLQTTLIVNIIYIKNADYSLFI